MPKRTSKEVKKQAEGTSLVVQWLRLQVPNAGGSGSIHDQETTSHMPQLKIPQLRPGAVK